MNNKRKFVFVYFSQGVQENLRNCESRATWPPMEKKLQLKFLA